MSASNTRSVLSSATVAAYAVIGRGSRVGERARIGAHVSIGAECELADDVVGVAVEEVDELGHEVVVVIL